MKSFGARNLGGGAGVLGFVSYFLSVLPNSANALKTTVSFDALLTSKGSCLNSVLATEHPKKIYLCISKG